jgi:hypothetical protein
MTMLLPVERSSKLSRIGVGPVWLKKADHVAAVAMIWCADADAGLPSSLQVVQVIGPTGLGVTDEAVIDRVRATASNVCRVLGVLSPGSVGCRVHWISKRVQSHGVLV